VPDAVSLRVTVPASSANLGAGFDVLGLALSLTLTVSTDPAVGQLAAGRHPARQAFERVGGVGDVFVDERIPSGRGLGFSGAARVGAAIVGLAQREGVDAGGLDEFIARNRDSVYAIACELEGHGDNVGASVYGGLVIASAHRAVSFDIAADVRVVVWVPSHTTSTDKSRAVLAPTVSREDAVLNIASATRLVGALVSGRIDELAGSTDDRMHQSTRLAASPAGIDVMSAFDDSGAECSWLSGSGPTIAAFVRAERCDDVVRRVSNVVEGGRVLALDIDRLGARASRAD